MSKKDVIVYNGNLSELFELADENGKVDHDKLMDWLDKSKDLEYSEEVKNKIKKINRKRKLNKLKGKQ